MRDWLAIKGNESLGYDDCAYVTIVTWKKTGVSPGLIFHPAAEKNAGTYKRILQHFFSGQRGSVLDLDA